MSKVPYMPRGYYVVDHKRGKSVLYAARGRKELVELPPEVEGGEPRSFWEEGLGEMKICAWPTGKVHEATIRTIAEHDRRAHKAQGAWERAFHLKRIAQLLSPGCGVVTREEAA